jgi:hypothetical protein
MPLFLINLHIFPHIKADNSKKCMFLCVLVQIDNTVLNLNALLQVSSQCQVPELARPCFQEITVKMSDYDEKFCAADNSDDENKDGAENVPPCMVIHQVRIFINVRFIKISNY